jgi:hypothetical protein
LVSDWNEELFEWLRPFLDLLGPVLRVARMVCRKFKHLVMALHNACGPPSQFLVEPGRTNLRIRIGEQPDFLVAQGKQPISNVRQHGIANATALVPRSYSNDFDLSIRSVTDGKTNCF